ncbi:hypothetical protein [Pseudoalteromonas pernae]|uniref:hypothetical protein n=1 Tax=Pseudoalteromonas pernae TaxID=3118054 RepID=UPI0032427493
MPIQTPAFKLICPSCGWSKVFPPMGDVRFQGQVPDKCPTCCGEQLNHAKPNIAEKMLVSIKAKL